MPEQKKELPKVPPFYARPPSGKKVQEPVRPTIPANSKKPNGHPSERGILNLAITLVSAISLGVAMLSGAWLAYGILSHEDGNQKGIISKVIVVGLTYAVGWLVSAFGIRTLKNLLLPLVIKIYAWITLGGILVLQLVIISKLFAQRYEVPNFVKYIILIVAGLVALIGLHLTLEKHSLFLFGIPILLVSLYHLFFVVFHYVFTSSVIHEKLWGDLAFFMLTTIIGVLMLAHFGILNGFRNFMDRVFNPKDNPFVPPD